MSASDGNPRLDQLLDDEDDRVLRQVRSVHEARDPVPDGLVARVQFALALRTVHAEVLRLLEDETTAAGARAQESARTITFDCPSLTVMIVVAASGADGLRIDGWLAPPSALRVELLSGSGRQETTTDTDGRFAFDPVGHGRLQVFVHRPPGDLPSVVTPQVVL